MAACGYTEMESARRMRVSVHTVRWYWRESRQRLGATNTTQAVSLAWLHKLIKLDTFLAEMAMQGARKA